MQQRVEELKTTQGSKINPKSWYIYRWSSIEEPDGFVSEAYQTKKAVMNDVDCLGQFHREGYQYYSCGRTHITTGVNLI